tara:strand:+ start:656 stop:1264 length:609 start_codon:yes stop_codon:yes gene_type:complete
MVIRVEKPEFNLRSKLNEISYSKLPYEKFPIGSVVQTVVNYPENTVVVKAHQPGGSNSFAETPDGQYRTTIHPMFENSLLLLDLTFLFGGNNNSSISGFKFMQSEVATSFSNASDLPNNASYSGGGNRQFTHGSSRQKDYDGNDRHTMHISAMVPAGNTEARTYSLFHYSESNITKYFNATTTDNSGCSFSPWRFTIQEIRQ